MKISILSLACLLTLLAANNAMAQKNDSYLLLNINLKDKPNYYPYRPYGSRSSYAEGGSRFGLQWIKNNSNTAAWRFGFSIYENSLISQGYSKQVADTFFYTYKGYEVLIPKLSIGKEWQKHIHKDVTVYAGGDLGFGLMKNPKMSIEERWIADSTGNNYNSSYAANQTDSRWIMTISIRPFAGMRMNFSRFTIGYEASLPRDYTCVLGDNIHKLNKATIQHQLSMGFKLGKMRNRK
jgi:hypothetical protein